MPENAAPDHMQLYYAQLSKNTEQEFMIASLKDKLERRPPRPAPLANSGYAQLAGPQREVKALEARMGDYETGERYAKMRAEHAKALAAANRENAGLRREIADLHIQVANVRHIWDQISEDVDNEHAAEPGKKERENEALRKKVVELEKLLLDEKARRMEKVRELYRVETELEEERGKVLKLKAQINRDYETSSIPSSQTPNHKKIENNRERTGRKPGGQPGHKGHPRKRHAPTIRTEIPAPSEYADSPDYAPTGKTVTRRVVGIGVSLIVNEHHTAECRHVRTGQRVHADFPKGVDNDVNYDGSVKALALLLNSRCNVSIAKVSELIGNMAGGGLILSAGMISGLAKEFSEKTVAERKAAFADMLMSPVLSIDFTGARVNGQGVNVAVCANPLNVLRFAREHKGHEGVKGTPFEDYQGIGVHDHDSTYCSYGGGHQERNIHPLRYLKDSMNNEPGLQWNRQMRGLLQEMIHFWKNLDPEDKRNPDEIDPDAVRRFEERYDEVLDLADKEYGYEPPGKYYVEGFNLSKRLRKFKENHLLFLHNRLVPPDNNLAERCLRVVKRKMRQMTVFRSFASLGYFCDALGVFSSLRAKGANLFESISSIFDRHEDKDGTEAG